VIETLFPYQAEGAAWLASKDHALLADEMGLGKSAQVIRACDYAGAFDILIVCPAIGRINWDREFKRFSPMDRPSTPIMTKADKPGPGVNIVSYDMLATNEKLKLALMARDWDVLVLDEAHYLKERTAKRTKACYGGNSRQPGLVHVSKQVWRLTGTPAPNNASELHTHLKSMGLTDLPYWDFVFRYCAGFESDYGYKITGHKNVEELRAMMAPKMLRRRKEQVLSDLPPITVGEVTVDRSEVELDPWFYENVVHQGGVERFLTSLKTIDQSLKSSLDVVKNNRAPRVDDVLAVLKSYSQSTSTLRRYIGLAKLPRVLDIIEAELESGEIEKIVLFAVHQQVIEQTRQRLRQFHPVTLYGKTTAHKRQWHVDKFQKDPTCRVFIGQILAAGTTISLTAASEVAFLEADWVPANNSQAIMRIHRHGQQNKCRARFFTCAGSVDEEVMKAVVYKTREITKIID